MPKKRLPEPYTIITLRWTWYGQWQATYVTFAGVTRTLNCGGSVTRRHEARVRALFEEELKTRKEAALKQYQKRAANPKPAKVLEPYKFKSIEPCGGKLDRDGKQRFYVTVATPSGYETSFVTNARHQDEIGAYSEALRIIKRMQSKHDSNRKWQAKRREEAHKYLTC